MSDGGAVLDLPEFCSRALLQDQIRSILALYNLWVPKSSTGILGPPSVANS